MKPKVVKRLTIDRSKWYRGKRQGSRLLTSSGKMCCMGFYGEALGVPLAVMRGVSLPQSAEPEYVQASGGPPSALWPDWLFNHDSHAAERRCERLAEINDDEGISEAEREKKVRAYFKAHGRVQVVFTDGKPQPKKVKHG